MMKHNIWDKYFPCASVCLSWAHSLHLAKMLRIHQKWVMLTVIIIKHTYTHTQERWWKLNIYGEKFSDSFCFVFLFPAQTLSQVLV